MSWKAGCVWRRASERGAEAAACARARLLASTATAGNQPLNRTQLHSSSQLGSCASGAPAIVRSECSSCWATQLAVQTNLVVLAN